MNAFYVTVSIPLLLVLAGFNHAHGLTTFGKSQQSQQQQQTTNHANEKKCTNQSNCTLIKNTTCLRGSCLCGDNHPPNNGVCTNSLGPNHICTRNEDCVDNADCIPIREIPITKEIAHLHQHPEPLSLCRCQEGYTEIGATCGGGINLGTIPFFLLALVVYKISN